MKLFKHLSKSKQEYSFCKHMIYSTKCICNELHCRLVLNALFSGIHLQTINRFCRNIQRPFACCCKNCVELIGANTLA